MSTPVELHVTVLNGVVDVVTDALWARSPSAIEERPVDDDHTMLLAGFADREQAHAVAVELTDARWCAPHQIAVHEFTDESWLDEWREHARPVRVGRFILIPSWLDANPTDPDAAIDGDSMCIRIDAGRAFGSGSHPTTRLMLAAVERLVAAGTAVLDVGCGSGVLAIAAAASGGSPVVALDVDPAAHAATSANVTANDLAGAVSVSLGALGSEVGVFDVVLANLLAPTIEGLAGDLAERVAPEGLLVLSGLLADRWGACLEWFPDWSVSSLDTEDGWAAITLAPKAATVSTVSHWPPHYGASR